MSVRFATSQRNDMRPLSYQGVFATDCHEQLTEYLRRNQEKLKALGIPDPAGLLAEPMHDPSGVIDWYVPGNVRPVPFDELSEAEQNRLLRTMSQYAMALKAVLPPSEDVPPQGGQPEAGSLQGELLRMALRYPSNSSLYSLDGRPLLINWGFAPGTAGAVPMDIMRLGAARPTPPPPTAAPAAPVPPAAAPVQETRAVPVVAAAPALFPGCLSWLLPLLLLLLLLWLLLAALGYLPSPLPTSCFRQDLSAQSEELRKQSLDDEEAKLLQALRDRALLCKPKEPERPEPPVEKEPVLPDFSQPEPVVPEPTPEPEVTLPDFGTPVVPVEPEPEPKVEPKPEPKPAPKPKPKPRSNTMEIPEDAAKKNDLSFLEGCWRSRTDLYNTRGEQIEGEYCFDKKGRGRRFVYEKNQRCSGGATARFRGNTLVIEAPEARCPRGGGYVPQSVQCTGTDTATQCKGREHSRNGNTWGATFTRK